MVSSVVHFEDPLHAVNLTAKELQGSARLVIDGPGWMIISVPVHCLKLFPTKYTYLHSQFAGDLEGADDLWVHSFDRDCSLLSPPELRPFCR